VKQHPSGIDPVEEILGGIQERLRVNQYRWLNQMIIRHSLFDHGEDVSVVAL
jgi:hypothetical protein